LSQRAASGKGLCMTKDTSREERLAAKLRENLRKRKAQAKGHAGSTAEQADAPSDLSKSAKDS